MPNLRGSGWVRDFQEAATLDAGLIAVEQRVADAPTRGAYKDAVADLLRAWGNGSAYASASKQALAQGYGLILSEPENAQERGWMDVAVKGTAAERSAFRATLGADDLARFDAMRERMVGGLEKLAAYEAFTGFTFLTWNRVRGDALAWSPPTATGGRVPVVVEVPLSILLAQERNAVQSSESGYIRVTMPQPPIGVPHLDTLWNRLVDDAADNLMPTLRLAKYVDLVDVNFSADGVALNFDRLNTALDAMRGVDIEEAAALFLDLRKIYGQSFEGAGWDGTSRLRGWMQEGVTSPEVRRAFAGIGANFTLGASFGNGGDDVFSGSDARDVFDGMSGNDLIDGRDGDDRLAGGQGDDVVFGGDGDDVLLGGDGNDRLEGDAGNDDLEGGYGDDTIIGGKGNDRLHGGSGNNTYRFGLGDGQDTIQYVYDPTPGKLNTLAFEVGVDASMVKVERVIDNQNFGGYSALKVTIGSNGDQVLVQGFAVSDDPYAGYNPLQQIIFADGTVWSLSDIVQKTMNGSGGDDIIAGTIRADVMHGGAGNDVVAGRSGDDVLYGDAGDDVVDGQDGNDVIIGGGGNDLLIGGGGNNTYRFGLGDGRDTIQYVYDPTPGKLNTLAFEVGIDASMVKVERVIDNQNFGGYSALKVTIGSNGDQVLVQGFAVSDDPYAGYNPLQQIIFADGTVWSLNDIVQRTMIGTSSDDAIAGTVRADELHGGAGNDNLGGRDGDDVLYGEAGNDSLSGENGNDTLIGGAGNDTLNGGGGNNTYRFGLGDGQDTIQYVYDTTLGKLNTLAFEAGIDASMVSVKRVPDNQNFSGYATLLVTVGTGGDQVIVQGFAVNDDPRMGHNPLQQITFADGTVWSLDDIVQKTMTGAGGDETIAGTIASDVVRGGAGNDVIGARGGDDVLYGDAGDDALYGESGDDTLIGGTGNDTLNGGGGNNTYRFGLGDGQDTIQYVYDPTPGKLNTLAFEAGIDPSMVSVKRVLDNQNFNGYATLLVTVGAGGDQVIVQGFAVNDDPRMGHNPLQQITFADGTVWSLDDIVQKTMTGSGGDDIIAGTVRADVMYGGAGNDVLGGRDGDDVLYGEAGDDMLDAQNGNDTLIGGTGNDTLNGGGGNNTYRFGLGDGQDTIQYVYDTTPGKINTLAFEAGIDPSMVSVKRVLDNQNFSGYATLLVTVGTGGDQVIVQGFAVNDDPRMGHNPLQQITFADGTVWSLDDIVQKTMIGASSDDTIAGTVRADELHGGAGNDNLGGRDGDDVLYGEAGNDSLSGENGNDTLIGGAGDDTLNGGGGNNTYRFGLGDGQDTIQYVYDTAPGKSNVIEFDADVDPSSLHFRRLQDGNFSGYSALEIAYGSQGDKVVVQGFAVNNDALSPYNPLQEIRFADGTRLSLQDIVSALNAGSPDGGGSIGGAGTTGTSGDDVLTGAASVIDVIRGLAGNDVLNAAGGFDTLDGGDGDDMLNADYYAGETTYVGGKGNDTINGSYYNDRYVFDRGDGQDVINEAGPGYFNDTLAFGPGIAVDEVSASRSGVDLILKIAGGNDRITVKNWFDSDWKQIETVSFADGTTWTKAEINTKALEVFGTDGDDVLGGVPAFADVLHGGAGNDVLNASGGFDTLDGGDGDDVLNADYYNGETTYVGGKGNDTINGAYYNDHYVFDRGDGQDVITEAGPGYFEDTLAFGPRIAVADMTVVRSGVNLVFRIAGGDDRITVKNWFDSDWKQIETIRFADGTTWTKAQVNAMALEVFGSDGDDVLGGVPAFADVLHGGAGNDVLNASGGFDTLDGGDGDDVLNADYYQGETIYVGGKGNDTINGAYYNDHYVFDRGDGQDVINEGGPGWANDTLTFGAGIAVADMTVARSGVDLLFMVAGGPDQITVKNWFDSDWKQIETVTFADGTSWSKAQINSKALEVFGTSGDDVLGGVPAFADVLHGGAGNDVLNASGVFDTLDGGDGDDVLNADYYQGETTYIGGKGNDIINGAYYNDHYVFDRGDGQDVIHEGGPGWANDTLTFGAGIAVVDMTVVRSGVDLLFKVAGSDDRITVRNWFDSDWKQIETANFADGTTWTKAQINAMALEVFGTEGDDVMGGVPAFADVLHGGAGNDVLNASGGFDTLDGGDGDDVLNADYYQGETTYIGGKGNDTINGSYYADHYVFGRGDGQDTIRDGGPGWATDTLTFGSGISADQVWFRQVDNDLEVSVIGTSDQIVVKDWYVSGWSHVEAFRLGSGETLLDGQVSQLVDAMAAFDKPDSGQTDLPAGYQSTLVPIIASAWHA